MFTAYLYIYGTDKDREAIKKDVKLIGSLWLVFAVMPVLVYELGVFYNG